ncbi:hypothetical protein BGZ72_011079 [Mortierella alpina]|nr:hypothetical protein BGZ72_011079 [Mortierella alpina]
MRVGNLALAPLRRLTGVAQSVLGSDQARPAARSLYTFVGVFRGQRIETLREVSSDEEEHNTQPRLLWPDDGNDSEGFYDSDEDIEQGQHSHSGLPATDYASDSLSAQEHDHSRNDENQYTGHNAHRLEEHDTLATQDNVDRSPRLSSQQLFDDDDHHSQSTFSEDDGEDREATQQGYWPDSPAFHGGSSESTSVERPPQHARNGKTHPQEIDRGYRSETVVADMASLPDDGNAYYAGEELSTPVKDRARRHRPTHPIADGFESDDESDDDYAVDNAANPSRTSARSPQVITQKESHNPFIHIPEPQNEEVIHRERARRRAEARDNLGYVIRGQKYLIFPSLYEESEDPELYGSTVLWPSESTRNDADFTFSCPSTQNSGSAEVDEDDEDDAAAAKYGITLLPIPKRTRIIPQTSRAHSSEDEYDQYGHHQEASSGDSFTSPLESHVRPPQPIIDLSVDEDDNAAQTEAVEEEQSTQSTATVRVSDSWSGSTKRSSEDSQPESASKVLLGHSRQPSFAGPFEVLVERAQAERGRPFQPTFDFSVGTTVPAEPKTEEEPKWYRLSKSTVTTRVDPRENLAFTIPPTLPGSARRSSEGTQPERKSKILIDSTRQCSSAGPFGAASGQAGGATEHGGPFQPTFDFSVGEVPALPKAEEDTRWYRLSKSTTTVRVDPRKEAYSSTQDGGGPSSSHRGYGSSTYGSGDEDSDSGALNRSFDFEFKPGQPLSEATSRPTKGHGLVIQRPEKHRLEPDTCDLQGDDDDDDDGDGGGEHACSAFDSCWGTRKPVVGLYYWDDEEWGEGLLEGRRDKRFVLIRDPDNDD